MLDNRLTTNDVCIPHGYQDRFGALDTLVTIRDGAFLHPLNRKMGLVGLFRGFRSFVLLFLGKLTRRKPGGQDTNLVEIGKSSHEKRCRRTVIVDLVIKTLPLTRTTILGYLYFLTLVSILTTYAMWDFLALNSAKGTLETASYIGIARNSGSNARGLRGVRDFRKDLNDLFVIRPAESFKDQMEMQDGIIADFIRNNEKGDDKAAPQAVQVSNRSSYAGSFSCGNERPICPEIDIPGLVGKRKVDLRDMPMNDSEHRIFGPALSDVRSAVRRANDVLREKLAAASKRNVDWLFDSVVESEAIGLNDYWYLPGGHWKPKNCMPRWKVAIVIPYRDRYYHLPIILRYLIPMLQRQFLEFSFFIVEQANQELFNRAMLMNVGFLESLNFTNYDCFIIHDVDHVPLDDHNYYGCSGMPRHFVSGADRWNYKLPYDNFFGAVTGLTKGQIRRINGFPNVYWGWGGEDDEIWKRVKDVGLEISRMKGSMGHYDVIRHHHKSAPLAKERYGLLNSFKQRYKIDGLSDIVYPTPIYELHSLYTNVSVDIRKIKPHYPMPAVKGVSKDTHKKLMEKMSNMTLKARKAVSPLLKKSGPGVRKPGAKPVPVAAKNNESPQPEKAKNETAKET